MTKVAQIDFSNDPAYLFHWGDRIVWSGRIGDADAAIRRLAKERGEKFARCLGLFSPVSACGPDFLGEGDALYERAMNAASTEAK